jgi:hypothetical protein
MLKKMVNLGRMFDGLMTERLGRNIKAGQKCTCLNKDLQDVVILSPGQNHLFCKRMLGAKDARATERSSFLVPPHAPFSNYNLLEAFSHPMVFSRC